MIDESKLSALLVRLEAMATIQRPKAERLGDQIRAANTGSALYGDGRTRDYSQGRAAKLAIDAELGILDDVIASLRAAGVTDDSEAMEAPKTAQEATSGDYGASGEEVADIHRALQMAYALSEYPRCHVSIDNGQYRCILSPHGPDVECMIRLTP